MTNPQALWPWESSSYHLIRIIFDGPRILGHRLSLFKLQAMDWYFMMVESQKPCLYSLWSSMWPYIWWLNSKTWKLHIYLPWDHRNIEQQPLFSQYFKTYSVRCAFYFYSNIIEMGVSYLLFFLSPNDADIFQLIRLRIGLMIPLFVNIRKQMYALNTFQPRQKRWCYAGNIFNLLSKTVLFEFIWISLEFVNSWIQLTMCQYWIR